MTYRLTDEEVALGIDDKIIDGVAYTRQVGFNPNGDTCWKWYRATGKKGRRISARLKPSSNHAVGAIRGGRTDENETD